MGSVLSGSHLQEGAFVGGEIVYAFGNMVSRHAWRFWAQPKWQALDESARHEGHAGARPGGQTHWKLSIVSPRFAGKPAVARHRMVYEALGELMQDPIHALAITARTPEELKGNP